MTQKKLTDPYDIGWRDGYEARKMESYNAGYEEAKKLFENSILGHISWYDGFYLDYDPEEFFNLIYEKMGLEPGDEVMITISKINKQQNKRDE